MNEIFLSYFYLCITVVLFFSNSLLWYFASQSDFSTISINLLLLSAHLCLSIHLHVRLLSIFAIITNGSEKLSNISNTIVIKTNKKEKPHYQKKKKIPKAAFQDISRVLQLFLQLWCYCQIEQAININITVLQIEEEAAEGQ